MRRFIFSLILAMLFAGPAFATSSLTFCHETTAPVTSIDTTLAPGECAAWRFNQDNEDSLAFHFQSATGKICFDPNTGAAGADTAQVMIWHCPTGVKPSANFGYTCLEILDGALTGLVGANGTQNACVAVSTGTYFSEVTTPDAGVSSVVYFQADGE